MRVNGESMGVMRVRLGRNATTISLLVVIGVRVDGRKAPLVVRIPIQIYSSPPNAVETIIRNEGRNVG